LSQEMEHNNKNLELDPSSINLANNYSDALPLVPMRYFPNRLDDIMPTSFKQPQAYPLVVKVGTAHAGYGKMCANNESEFEDMESILKMHKSYYTTEPYLNFSYEFRVQKIGINYRGFKRSSASSWKSNCGDLKFEDFTLEEKHIKWVNACSTLLGGLDILAIDVVHMEDGKEYILELNDTAIGLMHEHEKEDSEHIRDLVIEKMSALFSNQ